MLPTLMNDGLMLMLMVMRMLTRLPRTMNRMKMLMVLNRLHRMMVTWLLARMMVLLLLLLVRLIL